MGTLVDALLERVKLVRARVDSITRDESGWGVLADGEWQVFDRIVMACGANWSAPLLASIEPQLSDLLAAIPYTGSAIWTFGYRREDVPHALDAFGFLVPKPERRTVMACTWLQTKWLGRVPEGKAVFRCFSTDPDVTRDAVQGDLERLMDIKAEPIFALNHRWPDSMPQYTVGHSARVAEIEGLAAGVAGLHLVGNAFGGIGIPDCVRSAKTTAAAIAASGAGC
jgi:oxygen-dependent protoporphyrinogen oxidase